MERGKREKGKKFWIHADPDPQHCFIAIRSLYKKLKIIAFWAKSTNHYFFVRKKIQILTFLYVKRYKSLLFPANMYKSLLFRTKKLGIIMFSYKNRNLFNWQPCTLYTYSVICRQTVDPWKLLLYAGLSVCGKLFNRQPCTVPLDCWSAEITGTLDSQSAESCSVSSPVLCR